MHFCELAIKRVIFSAKLPERTALFAECLSYFFEGRGCRTKEMFYIVDTCQFSSFFLFHRTLNFITLPKYVRHVVAQLSEALRYK